MRITKTAGYRMCILSLIGLASTPVAQGFRWEDRVLPLPKEMAIAGSSVFRAGDIGYRMQAAGQAPVLKTAQSLLASFAKGEWEKARLRIDLVLVGEQPDTLPAELRGRLRTLPNASQAYALSWTAGTPSRITLAANTPVGLLYGAQTLTQLLKPGAGVGPEARLEIPHARILDWPDIALRGTRESTAYLSFGWNSQWKLNFHCMRFTTWRGDRRAGGMLPATEIRYLDNIDSDTFRAWMRWAHELGYIYTPGINHLGILAARGLRGISPAVYTAASPAPKNPLARGFCWAKGQEIYTILGEELRKAAGIAAEFPADHRIVEVVLTEHEGTSCHCPECKGESGYVMEAEAAIEVFEKIKQACPGLKLVIVLSQGSRPVNDRIMRLISAREDVGVAYYDGILTYRTDRIPLIPAYIEEFARNGGDADVLMTLIPGRWDTQIPGSLPQYVKGVASEFASKKLRSASHYDMVGAHFYWPLTTAAWGEFLWNPHGRSAKEFARAYATISGTADPELFSCWAEKAGTAALELGVSQYMMHMGGDRYTFLPKVVADDARQELNTIRLGKALRDAIEAVRLARAADKGVMLWESAFTLAALKSLALRREISEQLGHVEQRDAVCRKLDELELCGQVAVAAAYAWHRQASDARQALAEAPGVIRPPKLVPQRPWGRDGERVVPGIQQWRPWHSLLKVSDAERLNASALGIPDSRRDRAPREIARWDVGDFVHRTARIERDISELVPLTGGHYELELQTLEGTASAVRVCVSCKAADTGQSREISSMVTWDMKATRENDSHYSYLLSLPERRQAETLTLEIRLTPQAGKVFSKGRISLRKVRSWGSLTQAEIESRLE